MSVQFGEITVDFGGFEDTKQLKFPIKPPFSQTYSVGSSFPRLPTVCRNTSLSAALVGDLQINSAVLAPVAIGMAPSAAGGAVPASGPHASASPAAVSPVYPLSMSSSVGAASSSSSVSRIHQQHVRASSATPPLPFALPQHAHNGHQAHQQQQHLPVPSDEASQTTPPATPPFRPMAAAAAGLPGPPFRIPMIPLAQIHVQVQVSSATTFVDPVNVTSPPKMIALTRVSTSPLTATNVADHAASGHSRAAVHHTLRKLEQKLKRLSAQADEMAVQEERDEEAQNVENGLGREALLSPPTLLRDSSRKSSRRSMGSAYRAEVHSRSDTLTTQNA
ncbi:hypothetical protein HDU82_006221 [Entophlyctis luteolus]|nr:hypothetical protein HDU82_006221 [Entophlyctis luteolus]